jgi:catechol 2,3-dioxygenase-like lactoylglutathione lyase family enzyme
MFRNPDHVTIAVADAANAVKFFELLGFRKQHVAMIDGGARRDTWACRT